MRAAARLYPPRHGRHSRARSPASFSSCARASLAADFSLRNTEHLLLWEMANERIISEYVRQFSKRCVELEARALAEQAKDEAIR